VQVALDTCDRTTVYADLRADEPLTEALRARAIDRALQLGATHVEFWRPPYGQAANRMLGFVERAQLPAAAETNREAGEPAAPRDPHFVTAPIGESVEQV
jgi:hypothetical protein